MNTALEDLLASGMRERATHLTVQSDLVSPALRRHRRRTTIGRTFSAVGTLGLAGAVAAAAGVLPGRAGPDGVGTGPGKTMATPPVALAAVPMTLAAFEQAATAAIGNTDLIRYTVDTSKQSGVTMKIWSYDLPGQAQDQNQAGSEPRRMQRQQNLDSSGHVLIDIASRFQAPGIQEQIEYVAATKEYRVHSADFPIVVLKTQRPSTDPSSIIDAMMANPNAKLIGPTRLGNKPAILITFPLRVNGRILMEEKIWFDATSYLPLQIVHTSADGSQTSTSTYSYLSPSAQNLAQLWFTPQPGWKQVSHDPLIGHFNGG